MTSKQLGELFPGASDDDLSVTVDELTRDAAAHGIDTVLRQAHFLAQIMQEAGPGLDSPVENLSYSPSALKATFKYYADHPDEAEQDGYLRDPVTKKITRPANQQNVANKAYANRNGNGDVASGDGWQFRGRGMIQVTGRGNYAATSQRYQALYGGAPADFVANPDLLAESPYAIRSAICFWVEHALQKVADGGNNDATVDAITAIVDKNTQSYAERRANFARAYQVLGS